MTFFKYIKKSIYCTKVKWLKGKGYLFVMCTIVKNVANLFKYIMYIIKF